MADEEFSFDVQAHVQNAEKELNRFISTVGRANDATGHMDKGLQSTERNAVKLARQMRDVTASFVDAERAAKRFRSNTNLKGFTPFGKEQQPDIQQNVPRAFQASSRAAFSTREPDAFTESLNRQREATRLQAVELQRAGAEAKRTNQAFEGLANTRYALFDVSRALTIVSAATLGVSIAAIKTEADFESLLVQVQRTAGVAGEEWNVLRDSIIGLSTEIPASIDEITQIATLAGQLGIASEDIDSFTESVIKFASTTDVTAEAGAESIGRVAQLAGVAGDEYDNLTASIYQVGITSVSTESDILSVTSQIAVSARQAGFAAEQTVALSSALASLGVAPERARGSIQRVFNIITNSVDNGSEELATFAALSNMTAEQFATKWKDDAQGGFLAFLEGLGRAGDAGENMNNILSEVGINAVRDSDALRRLAQNTEVYTQAIDEASEGWNDGSAFAEGYGLVAETLGARLERLVSTLKAIVEAAQDNEGLKQFVGFLQVLAEALLSLIDNPVGQFFTAVVILVTTATGVFAALAAGAVATAASLMAVVTAMRFVAQGQREGVRDTKLFSIALIELVANLRGVSAASVQAGVAQQGLAKGLIATGGAGMVAGRSIQVLRGALISSGIGIAVVALGTVAAALSNIGGESEATTARMESLTEAVRADAKVWDELNGVNDGTFREMTAEVEVNTDQVVNNTDAVNDAFDSSLNLSDAVTGVTSTIEDQTIAIGKNTQEWINNNAAQTFLDTFGDDPQAQAQGLADLASAQERYGFTVQQVNQAVYDGNVAYLDSLENKLFMSTLNDELTLSELAVAEAALAFLDNADSQVTTMNNLAATTQATSTANEVFDATLGETAEGMEDQADAAETATDAMQGYVDEIFKIVDARGAFVSALGDLGASLYENGNDFSAYTEGGRENLAALKDAFSAAVTDADGDASVLAVSVESIISGMEAQGFTGVRNLQIVRDMAAAVASDIASITNTYASASTRAGLFQKPGAVQPFPARVPGAEANNALRANLGLANQVTKGFDGARKAANNSAGASRNAGNAAKDAQKEVRTLSDYVSDLESVMDDAFNFRFGFQQAKDETKDAFRTIADSLDDAREKARDLRQSIQELRATLSGLSSDRNILQYQLTIAREYGDTLREEAILAELQDNTAAQSKARNDLADETKDLGKEEEFLKKNLKGGTEEAAEHRDMVLSLVESYKDQIAAYADTGASQQQVEQYAQELRTEFQRQLTQLGYNKDEIKTYSRAFDDFVQIVKELPRNITVKVDANTSPAQRALDEYFSKNKNRTVTQTVNTKYTSSGNPRATTYGKTQKYQALAAQYEAEYRKSGTDRALSNWKYYADLLASGSYAQGGYTGKGGKYQPAGVVHKDEFVFDKESTNAIGPRNLYAMMDAAKRGSAATGGMMGGSMSAVNFPGMMALTPGTIQQIARAVQNNFFIEGQQVGRAASRSYAENNLVGAN